MFLKLNRPSLRLSFILLFIALTVMSYSVSFAANTSNYVYQAYKVTYKATRTQSELPYFPKGVINVSDFTNKLIRNSGFSGFVDYKLYVTQFYLHITKTEGIGGTTPRDENWNCFLLYKQGEPSNTIDYRNGETATFQYDSSTDFSAQQIAWQLTGESRPNDRGMTYYGVTGTKIYFDIVVTIGANFYVNLGDVIDAIENVNNDITVEVDKVTQAVKDQTKQELDWRNEDKSSAQGVESSATSFINNTSDTVKSKWEILFYPIEFTNQLLTVFTGGTSTAEYIHDYGIVEGYTYNEDTGCLDPILNPYKPIPTAMNQSVDITFPSYTLPVLNLKLWNSYTFDLMTVKDNFPVLFNSLYIVVGSLEVYWFVGFLRDKYDDVFGG